MKNSIPSSEITPESVYQSRRRFLKGIATITGAALLGNACSGPVQSNPTPTPTSALTMSPSASVSTDEIGNKLTLFENITSFVNYYEFTSNKNGVAEVAKNFITSPWTVDINGKVAKPQKFEVTDLIKRFGQEERIYRMRCVETWSMVIPWFGVPLRRLLEAVEPTSEAKYVRFDSVFDPNQMPGQKGDYFKWPYSEGLRLDEAMNDLTLLATGIYGKPLLPQNGAPIRLVVPWKYGFKSIKSVVHIELVSEKPKSFWMTVSPDEYGFFANVNPGVPHPRWSQAKENRYGEDGRKETLLFNGYGSQVADIYKDMDLVFNY